MNNIDELVEQIFSSITGAIRRAINPIEDRITDLINKLSELEQIHKADIAGLRTELLSEFAGIELGNAKFQEERAIEVVKDIKLLIQTTVDAYINELPAPKAGKDFDLDAVLPVIEEKVAAAVATIPVPENGRDGRDGEAGKDFDLDAVLPVIEEKVAAAVATIPVPENGRDGRDGEAGKDAIEIDILEQVDVARRYQRGTYAKYKGGVIRSFRITDPIDDGGIEKAGWTVIWVGIDDVLFDQNDNCRSFGIGAQLSNGNVSMRTFALPVVIYRGVFKEGMTYAKGDSVTWGGSTWIADRETKDKPDLVDTGWILTAKKGQPGKQGEPGKDGKDGLKGKDGRDAGRY